MSRDPKCIVRVSLATLDGIERSAYRDGWRWGVASGFIVGLCTTAMGTWLIHEFAAAWVL